MKTQFPADVQADPRQPEIERNCECDCTRWAHQVYGICLRTVPVDALVLMFFDNDLNQFGPYPRRVCAHCAEHIAFARARGGERLDDSQRPDGVEAQS